MKWTRWEIAGAAIGIPVLAALFLAVILVGGFLARWSGPRPGFSLHGQANHLK